MKSSDSIKVALENVFGKNYGNKLRTMNHYKISTVEQLWNVISVSLPELTDGEIKKRGLYHSYKKASKRERTDEQKTIILQKTLKTGKREAAMLLLQLKSVEYPHKLNRRSLNSLSCGGVLGKGSTLKSFWMKNPRRNSAGSHYLLPDYYRMGEVFDQGNRGTCVANAATSLVDYLANTSLSRQFLYHQCKMIDGMKNESGTLMWVPISILNDERLIDYGTVSESDWKYNKNWEKSEDQGPPPERCFNTERYFGYEVVTARVTNIVSDIKTLLVGSDLAKPVPVTVGLALFQSFVNDYANRTGWINMPLPGEKVWSGHAMLVVGYNDEHEVFIVRNSWGVTWAAENPFNFPGHALIPYDYFKEYCASGDAITVCETGNCNVKIPEEDRLYNRPVVELEKLATAALPHSKKTQGGKSRRKKKIFLKKFFYSGLVIVILALILRIGAPDIFYLIQYWLVELYYRLSYFAGQLL
jgi:C1A family cysteine protease